MSVECKNVIVCDSGTGFVKCGYAGSTVPAFSFPSLVGRPNLRTEMCGDDHHLELSHAVGDETHRFVSPFELHYPMETGAVRNWDDMINVWDYTFGQQKMNIEPANCKILLTESSLNNTKDRGKIVELMFDHYGFAQICIAARSLLTLFSVGLYSGVVVDSGEGVTHISPIYESVEQLHATRRLDIAGRDITRQLIRLLLHRGYAFNESADFETIRRMKEQLCYVSSDVRVDHRLSVETTYLVRTYTLPDGRQVRLGAERFEAPEILFQPRLIGVEGQGLAEAVFSTIQCVELCMRPEMYRHIVLSGGTSMFPGFATRFKRDLEKLYVAKALAGDSERFTGTEIKVMSPPHPKDAVFVGGSMLARAASNYEEFWISKDDYLEKGVKVLEELPLKYSSLATCLLKHRLDDSYNVHTSNESMNSRDL